MQAQELQNRRLVATAISESFAAAADFLLTNPGQPITALAEAFANRAVAMARVAEHARMAYAESVGI